MLDELMPTSFHHLMEDDREDRDQVSGSSRYSRREGKFEDEKDVPPPPAAPSHCEGKEEQGSWSTNQQTGWGLLSIHSPLNTGVIIQEIQCG